MKNLIMKKIITLVFVLAIIQPGFSQNKNLEDKDEKLKQANLLFDGEVYYVSMDGNNKNDGSFDAPFFANKYPFQEALKIFGADRSHGAQKPELTIPED
jgi:hypothetical protein